MGSGRFSGPVTPGPRFQGRRQNSSFLRFLAIFMGNNTLFWATETMFVSVTPRTRFQGRRQNLSFSRFLAVFVGHSTLFWVPEMIFVASDRRCMISSAYVKTHYFRVFWPFSWAIARCFGFRGLFSGARHPRFTVSGPTSKLIVLAFFGRFRGL